MTDPTFRPLAGGKYVCNQTGDRLTKRQIPGYINSYLNGGEKSARAALQFQHKERSSQPRHASRYRTRHQ